MTRGLLLALSLLLAGCSVSLLQEGSPAPVSGVQPGDYFTEAAAYGWLAWWMWRAVKVRCAM